MKNIYLAIIALLLNTHIYAQNAPALNGKILYHSYSSYDNWDGELFILDLSDNSVTNISSGWSVSHAINGMFSPDGTKIVFMADEDGWLQDWDIFLWTIGDEEPVNLTGPFSTDREEDPKFSPDGKTIVFKKNGDIVTMDLEGNIIATLTNTPGVEESMPYYTSDGSKVLYAPGAGAGSDVYIMDADGANSQALVAQSNYQEYYPAIRDNESFFYTGWVSSSNLNDQIYLKYYSSDSSIYLPFNQSNANFSDATPVGLDYAVISSSKSGGYGGYDLYIADINTGDIWSLNNYNNSVNSSWEDLGAHYLPKQNLSSNNSIKSDNQIYIFPNPVMRGKDVKIKTTKLKRHVDSRIEVYNIQGQILQTDFTHDLSDYSLTLDFISGVYFVKIFQNRKIHVEKIILK